LRAAAGSSRLGLHRTTPDTHAVDPFALGVHDLEHETAIVDALACPRNAPEHGRDQPADGADFAGFDQRRLERLLQTIDVDAAGHEHGTVGLDGDGLRL